MKILTKDILAQRKPSASFAPGVNLKEQIRLSSDGRGRTVAEFVGTGDFAAAFVERQRYEVDAGRAEEPLLYQSFYNTINDPALPQSVTVYTLGPGGVIFEQVLEGGEVKFSTVGEGQFNIPIVHYGAAIEYSKDLVVYNQQWNLGIFERAAGIAYNALLNHLHLSPILTAAYGAANQTAASTDGFDLGELYLRTIEDAITNATMDASHPRRGPYDLLISTADLFTVERALQWRANAGIDVRSSAVSRVQNIIAYDGTTLARGKVSVTYAGVNPGTAYLISKQYASQDFISAVKQDLEFMSGDGDISRFIVEQVVGDAYLGVYANPLAAVEEITWPVAVAP